jgi:benzodiazapine receptor
MSDRSNRKEKQYRLGTTNLSSICKVGMVVVEFIAIVCVAALGGFISAPAVKSDWYRRLNQPPGQPPGWLFGGIWPALYLLMFFAIALVTAWWCQSCDFGADNVIVMLFWLQLLLNFLWIIVFFGYQSIDAGLVVIVALLAVVGLLMVRYFQAGYLTSGLFTVPYFLWLMFATYLSVGIFMMNRSGCSV